MNIAVNTKKNHNNDIDGNDIEQLLIKFAKANQDHQFIFFTNAEIAETKNIVPVFSKPSLNALSAKLWGLLKLPALLKKHNAAILININLIQKINTEIPQLQIIEQLPKIGTSKKDVVTILYQSKKIIATSQFIKDCFIKQYKIAEEKIDVLHLIPNEKFIAIDWHQKQIILKKYSTEKEYFLFTGDNHTNTDLLDLLKAFSVFKKWQKSNLQLIIADKQHSLSQSFITSLKTYKYRDEVIVLDCDENQLAEITAAAYCVIDLNKNNSYLPLLQAFQCNVPAITTNSELNKEICENAALYSATDNFNDLAKNMILVYKDEHLRNELITNGVAQTKRFSNTANLSVLNNVIEQTLQA